VLDVGDRELDPAGARSDREREVEPRGDRRQLGVREVSPDLPQAVDVAVVKPEDGSSGAVSNALIRPVGPPTSTWTVPCGAASRPPHRSADDASR